MVHSHRVNIIVKIQNGIQRFKKEGSRDRPRDEFPDTRLIGVRNFLLREKTERQKEIYSKIGKRRGRRTGRQKSRENERLSQADQTDRLKGKLKQVDR